MLPPLGSPSLTRERGPGTHSQGRVPMMARVEGTATRLSLFFSCVCPIQTCPADGPGRLAADGCCGCGVRRGAPVRARAASVGGPGWGMGKTAHSSPNVDPLDPTNVDPLPPATLQEALGWRRWCQSFRPTIQPRTNAHYIICHTGRNPECGPSRKKCFSSSYLTHISDSVKNKWIDVEGK